MIDANKNNLGQVLSLIMALLTLTACGTKELVQTGSENSGENLSATIIVQPSNSDSPTLAVDDLPESADSASGSANAPELGFALGDPNLKATDPSTVSLVSGQIQVIEFFAFW